MAAHYKVLFVLTPALHPNAGGVQMSTCKLGRHFLSLGHEVSVFSFAAEGHSSEEPMALEHAQHKGGHREPRNLAQLEEVLQRVQPDIVINQMPYEHEIGEVLAANKSYLLLACLRNTLYSVRSNIDNYIDAIFSPVLSKWMRNPVGRQLMQFKHKQRHGRVLRSILDTYDHFVMFGPPNLEELSYFVPDFDKEKIRLVPNSIPHVPEAVPAKEKRLLWLGRVATQQKRAELILPIWEAVSRHLPDWELDIVGDGPQLEALRQQAAERQLERVHFHGRQVPDEYYRRAAIFFMTSAFEGFPNTLVEAQSHGAIPVVFDSYPVASWIVEEGKSGHLIKPFDVEAMVSRIVAVAESAERDALASQVLESVRRFQVDEVGQQWQALFDAEVPKHVAAARPAREAS